LIDDEGLLDGVDTVGVDETAFLAVTPLAGCRFATGIGALNSHPRLLDVVDRRSGTAVRTSGFRPRPGMA